LAGYGFGYTGHFEYAFPYRDGGEYPALGMLFRKGTAAAEIMAPSLLDGLHRYLARENERAKAMAGLLRTFPGVIVWGAGDNSTGRSKTAAHCPACAIWCCWIAGLMWSQSET